MSYLERLGVMCRDEDNVRLQGCRLRLSGSGGRSRYCTHKNSKRQGIERERERLGKE